MGPADNRAGRLCARALIRSRWLLWYVSAFNPWNTPRANAGLRLDESVLPRMWGRGKLLSGVLLSGDICKGILRSPSAGRLQRVAQWAERARDARPRPGQQGARRRANWQVSGASTQPRKSVLSSSRSPHSRAGEENRLGKVLLAYPAEQIYANA